MPCKLASTSLFMSLFCRGAPTGPKTSSLRFWVMLANSSISWDCRFMESGPWHLIGGGRKGMRPRNVRSNALLKREVPRNNSIAYGMETSWQYVMNAKLFWRPSLSFAILTFSSGPACKTISWLKIRGALSV